MLKGPSPGAKLNVKLTTVLSESSEKPSNGSRKFQSSNGKTMLSMASSGGGQKIIKIKKSANFNMSGSGP